MATALAVAGRNDQAELLELEIPDPGPDQVKVRVEAASLNGMDAMVAAGYLWDMMPHEFPVVIGRDFVGVVAEVGDAVKDLAVGDRVGGLITDMTLGVGAIATEVTVPAETLTRVPDDLDSTVAAALGLAAVSAVDMIDALALTADDVVLVSGATGGVGVYAVQLAKATGATVIATARPGEATELVNRLGADHVVDHTKDLTSELNDAGVESVTAIAHVAGDPAMLASLLASGGRLVSVIGATAEQAGRADVEVTPIMAVATHDKMTRLFHSVANGSLQAPIANVYPLEAAVQALADFNQHKTGKLVITG
jgi:NADPH:quinone reductase-like Zn-dependent oxidoreductase